MFNLRDIENILFAELCTKSLINQTKSINEDAAMPGHFHLKDQKFYQDLSKFTSNHYLRKVVIDTLVNDYDHEIESCKDLIKRCNTPIRFTFSK